MLPIEETRALNIHPNPRMAMANATPRFIKTNEGFHGWLHNYRLVVPPNLRNNDPLIFHHIIEDELLGRIREESNELGPIKFQYTFVPEIEKVTEQGVENETCYLGQRKPMLLNAYNRVELKRKLRARINELKEQLGGWTERGSGWTYKGIKVAYLDISRNNPLRGGTYIPLPQKLKDKQAIINVKSRDNACIKWALKAAHFQILQNPERTSKYPQEDVFNFTGISFPTPLHEIPKIERQNGIAITVLGWDGEKAVIYHVSEMDRPGIPSLCLMLITALDQDTGDPIYHYRYIKSLSRLLRQQYYDTKRHFCTRCLQGYTTEGLLEKHRTLCKGVAYRPTRIDMPEKGKNILQLTNYQKEMKASFVIYADSESILEKMDTCIPAPGESSTTQIDKHKPCGFSFVAVRSDGEVVKDFLYRGEDCVQRFLAALVETESELRESLKQKAPLQMTEQDWRDFKSAASCHICKKDLVKHNHLDAVDVFCPNTGEYLGKAHRFKKAQDSRLSCFFEVYNEIKPDDGVWAKRQPKPSDAGDLEKDGGICIHCDKPLLRPQFRDAVIDHCHCHCHITGQYRGAAHNTCNRSYFRIDPKRTIMPVVFHNLKSYDAHHLMLRIAEVETYPQGTSDLRCIPNNNEKYISFSLGRLRFIDSNQFLLSALDSLVLSNKHEDFEIIKRLVCNPENRGLLFRKGVYPYEYMDSFEKFNEPSLPPKEAFYSKLTKSGITDEDYVHAKQVWEAFECENLGDYHDIYLATDAILLADVFENFRKTCLKHYELDPRTTTQALASLGTRCSNTQASSWSS